MRTLLLSTRDPRSFWMPFWWQNLLYLTYLTYLTKVKRFLGNMRHLKVLYKPEEQEWEEEEEACLTLASGASP